MENRYKLPKGLQRRYLMDAEKRSECTSDEMAKMLGIVGRSYRDWRRGKFGISQKAVEIIERKFGLRLPYSKKVAFEAWRLAKISASSKGGIAVSVKYGGPGTLEGRREGGRIAIRKLREKGIVPWFKKYILPTSLDENLAQFVGILLGDGGLSKWQVNITLNTETEADFIEYVMNLGEKLFGERPKFIKRKDSKAAVIYYYGVSLVDYLVKIGLKRGNKVKQQVGVPEWVLTSPEYKLACLRGLVDTDGGIFIHKYKVNGKFYSYRKLCFVNRSMPLLYFVFNTLKGLDFNPKMITNVENKRVWLYNQEEVKRYLDIVGTSSLHLLSKF